MTRGPVAPGVGGNGGARATTGMGLVQRRSADGLENWEAWWERNREPFLDLHARTGQRTVETDSVGFHVGRGHRVETQASTRPSADDVRGVYLPQLLPLLAERHPDLVDSAVLAIARMLPAEEGDAALGALTSTLAHSGKTAREAATLALGVLGDVRAVGPLRQLLLDTPQGRRLTGRDTEVEPLVRAFAAISLGMLGAPETAGDLENVIRDPRLAANSDVKATAVLALGLLPQAHEGIVRFLLECLEDRSLDRLVKAQVPIALGKLHELHGGSPAAQGAVQPLVDAFRDDRTELDLLRSLAVSLGMLATVQHEDAVHALRNAVERCSDAQTRHFALLALAQIGARDPRPEEDAALHDGLQDFLLQELARPQRITHRPFAGLALALYVRGEHLRARAPAVAGKVLEVFQDSHDPSTQGALAVALGLLDATEAVEPLWQEFQDARDASLRGYLALALGMLHATAHADEFRALVRTRGLDGGLRLQLARALGLLGDREDVALLVAGLEEAGSLAEATSMATALGLIGDRSAAAPLLDVIGDAARPPLVRGLACAALGLLSEKTRLPWNVPLLSNTNYRANVSATAEIADIL